MEYIDMIYSIAERLPHSEEFNLKSQIIRSATSIALNIAEGSTSQSDTEFRRFVGISIRSLIETIACLHLIERRSYIDPEKLKETCNFGEQLFAKLQALRRSLSAKRRTADRRLRT